MIGRLRDRDELHDGTLGAPDLWAALALAALFVIMLAVTWNPWTHPVVDHAREMNIPARILAGDRLYTDIYYYYGPVAPYLGAVLYYTFGTHLAVLHGSGLVCAVLILAMLYFVTRQMLTPLEAALTTGLILIICALPSYFGNYVQPYAYAALYGWTLAVASLVCLVRYVTTRESRWLPLASVCVGLTMACKPEVGLLGL